MTANTFMSDKDQNEFFEALDRINRAGQSLRLIVWALGGIVLAGICVAAWVWNVNLSDQRQSEGLSHITTRMTDTEKRTGSLETWVTKHDAAPRVTLVDVHAIDKRVAQVEEKLLTIREQNAMIMETLRQIENHVK